MNATEALPQAQVNTLSSLYGGITPGHFIRGKHGITHYLVNEPIPAPTIRRVVVCAHGIGTDTGVFAGLIGPLLRDGLTVLRYDFFGHGWSMASKKWFRYTPDCFLEQLEALLDHVLLPDEPVACMVGHSTGGLTAILASARLQRPINKLALVSPCLWKNAPLLVKMADRFPEMLFRIFSTSDVLGKMLVADAYLKNCDAAFAKQGDAYLFAEAHRQARQGIIRMFELHPQIAAACVAITTSFFRNDLLPIMRANLTEITSRMKSPASVLLLWGVLDVVVPFKYAREAARLGPRITLRPLERQGHDSLFEDPGPIADAILVFMRPPSKL
mmetsp:Transcript_23838/g.39414  ORF Transcript_23838/g.39414 Transcript_23838/m.39414 type:complete len:329 (+) Transcript_23838:135-1121(+)|eukprot:CAMPEP_0119299378 /NCGR_PEP_ID=MMETSP1333-20130426/1426_1 /TAXON_ID=418940 /ORGANISM="Scyphosphaera apsteinii, Strain RCC1455" /LENGTH=328 /DNA_ID=CAMNT_0007300787 /DNA_START=128 /DNA_END=1114 /DNA_ORIENTATION=-